MQIRFFSMYLAALLNRLVCLSNNKISRNKSFASVFLLPLYKISTTMAKLNTADIGFEDQIWKAYVVYFQI